MENKKSKTIPPKILEILENIRKIKTPVISKSKRKRRRIKTYPTLIQKWWNESDYDLEKLNRPIF